MDSSHSIPLEAAALPEHLYVRTKVDYASGCWEWQGNHNANGYGRYGQRLAHRLSYEALVGPIPDGLTIDHLCRVRNCVNPGHMEPVTGIVNTMRGFSPAAQHARQTHCKRGHEFNEENTYFYNKGTDKHQRICRPCYRLAWPAYRENRKKVRIAG